MNWDRCSGIIVLRWQGLLSLQGLEMPFSQPFLFLGFLKIAVLPMVLSTQEQPMVQHAFPALSVHRFAAHFHLLPFRSASSLWLPGRQ